MRAAGSAESVVFPVPEAEENRRVLTGGVGRTVHGGCPSWAE